MLAAPRLVNVATQERSADVPVLEVVGGPGRLSRESLHELWHFREVLWAFVLRQVKVRYKQATIGVGWAINFYRLTHPGGPATMES